MTATSTTPASYFAALAPGEPVDLARLFSFHRARYGASTMEDGATGDDKGAPPSAPPGKDDDDEDDDDSADLGDKGKQALKRERDARKAAEKTAREQAARIATLEAATQSDAEKAVAEAKKEAKADAERALAPRLVMAEFRAASAGRIEPDRLADLTEDIDALRFVTEAGEVDVKKIAKKVDAWAPKKETRSPRPDPRQGAGDGTAGKTAGADGRAEAQRRYPQKQQ